MLRGTFLIGVAVVGLACSDPLDEDLGGIKQAVLMGTVSDADGVVIEGAQIRGRYRFDVCGSDAAQSGLVDWTVSDADGRFEYLITQGFVRPFTGCVLLEVEAPEALGLPTVVLEDLSVEFRSTSVPPDTLLVDVVFEPAGG